MLQKNNMVAIGALSIEQLTRMFSGLIIFTLLAAKLSEAIFGLYILTQSIILISSAVVKWGLDQIVLRDVSKQPEQSISLILASITIRTGASIPVIILTIIICTTYDLSPAEIFILILIIVLRILSIFETLIKMTQNRVKSATLISCYAIGSIPIKYVIISEYAELKIALLILLFDTIIFTFTPMYYVLKDYTLRGNTKIQHNSLRYLREGSPILVAGLLFSLYNNIDNFMIEKLSGFTELSRYGLYYKIFATFQFFPGMLLAYYTTKISGRIHTQPKNTLASEPSSTIYTVLRIYKEVILICLVIICTISLSIIASQSFLDRFLGQNYTQNTTSLLLLLTFCQCGVLWLSIQNHYSIFKGVLTRPVLVNGSVLVLNIGFNFLLIPNYGANGAALALVLAYLATLLIINSRKIIL